MKICLLVIIFEISVGLSTKYPNDIEGSPTIECGRDTINIKVKTTNGMASRIFAKNQHENEKCSFKSSNSATFVLSECGMTRQRQLEPRGLSFNLVVVVQLHPLFLTKVDRAYNLKCFYVESGKTVTASLEVSMLQTDNISSGGEAAPEATSSSVAAAAMPQCNYTLHMESPSGPLAKYAKIGDKVWHLWECSSDVFGVLIHSCYVTDGTGNEYKILDETGCGIDQYVLKTPEYSVTLNKAQQETHVFKFADKMIVLFNCQIKLCMKADDGCKGITPPDCSNATSVTGERLELSTHRSINASGEGNMVAEKKLNESESEHGHETLNKNITEKLKSPTENETKVDHITNGTVSSKDSKEIDKEVKEMGHNMNATVKSGEHENLNETSKSSNETLKGSNETVKGQETGPILSSLVKNETVSENGTSKEGNESKKIHHEPEDKFILQMFFTKNQTGPTNETRERRHVDDADRAEKLRRILMDSVDVNDLETDVAQRIWVLEPEETSPVDNHDIDSYSLNKAQDYDESRQEQVCVSNSKFAIIIGCLLFCLILSLIFVICLCILMKRKSTNAIANLNYRAANNVKPLFGLLKD